MAYIKVDHSRLNKYADKISEYISQHRSSMYRMNSSVETLSAVWQGDDYNQVKKEWSEIRSDDSTSERMLNAIQGFENSVRTAASKYRDAQARAINRANQLCK
ncbi:MAG: WXG100 family type VII secretion target [Ruminococcus sp.]|nr:WXG100 family type VII secretion target [Ruminococcus sp.]